MYKIQANKSGTRHVIISEEHLLTLRRYRLLDNLVDSNGIVDDSVLDKLKFNIRAILETENGNDRNLLNLCLDVIYNQNMKAFALKNLIGLSKSWAAGHQPSVDDPETVQ